MISIFADRIARGEPALIHGDGQQTRDFVFVGDVVSALIGAMARARRRDRMGSARVYNVCSGERTSVMHLAHLLMSLCSCTVPIVHAAPRDSDIRHSVGSPERLAREVGVRPATPLPLGLVRTLDALDEVASTPAAQASARDLETLRSVTAARALAGTAPLGKLP